MSSGKLTHPTDRSDRSDPSDSSLPARDAALTAAAILVAIYFGSSGLKHFDLALTGYCVATIISFSAFAYRVSHFWRRRPSAFYGRIFLAACRKPRSLLRAAGIASRNLGAQAFIAPRSKLRWMAHMLMSWGTLAGFAITVPLVWGWIHFEAGSGDSYIAHLFAQPLLQFDTGSLLGWLIFHQLNLAAVAVLLGCLYFIILRLRRPAADPASVRFHLGPLVLLSAVALTGLGLPLAAQLGAPWAIRVAAVAHEASVIVLLVALPYGKLIHIFIRPLQIGARLLRAEHRADLPCASCGAAFAVEAQLDAVQAMLAERGFAFQAHQRLCPSCRRRHLATAHAAVLGARFKPQGVTTMIERKAA